MPISSESKKPRGLGPFDFGGGSGVITGAASGIGRAIAMNLAGRGNDLALVDRDRSGLDAVRAELTRQYPDSVISTHVVDLAQPTDFDDLATAVAAVHPRVSLLINNAGVALNGTVDEISMADLDWVLAINLRAPIAMTKSFLPHLQRESGSYIVNVSSLYGLVAPAGQSAYAASKFGIRGFTLALQSELIPRGIGVSVVHPGGIATNIARNSRTGSLLDPEEAQRRRAGFARFLTMPPERAAAQIVDAVAHRRERVIITRTAVLVDVISRLMPVNHRHYLARQLSKPR
ncbi:SDR family NAD(P)-dependent oxidoreductase [Kocuria sp. cx-455]|uniref:SDR family NAD(P)-dependent oxidoreductase n=1 Tax=Kocuria sp. cx-455 TaxID=2771377 RepID=UPI003D75305B